MKRETLLEFAKPYYKGKDIMHDLWHIELLEKKVEQIIAMGNYKVDRESLLLATWFHGFIYRDEPAIIEWLKKQGYGDDSVERSFRSPGNLSAEKRLKPWKEKFFMMLMCWKAAGLTWW